MKPGTLFLRLALSAALVGITFNPSGSSFFHYAKATLPAVNGLFALASVVLVIAWVVLLRATLQSLGLMGVTLMVALLGAMVWVGSDLGVFNLHDGSLRTWLILAVITLVLFAGLSWSDLRRRLTGQTNLAPPPT
jgi:Family of unknown function (DUF6524)